MSLVRKLVKIDITEIKKETLFFTKKTQEWCKLKFKRGNLNYDGCPNYCKSENCPPNVPYLEIIKYKYNHFYLIYSFMDLNEYVKRRKEEWGEVSEGKLKNFRYYQKTIKNILLENVLKLKEYNRNKEIFILSAGGGVKKIGKQNNVYAMESVGINVFRTLLSNKIKIERNPKNFVRFVYLISSIEPLIIENKPKVKSVLDC